MRESRSDKVTRSVSSSSPRLRCSAAGPASMNFKMKKNVKKRRLSQRPAVCVVALEMSVNSPEATNRRHTIVDNLSARNLLSREEYRAWTEENGGGTGRAPKSKSPISPGRQSSMLSAARFLKYNIFQYSSSLLSNIHCRISTYLGKYREFHPIYVVRSPSIPLAAVCPFSNQARKRICLIMK